MLSENNRNIDTVNQSETLPPLRGEEGPSRPLTSEQDNINEQNNIDTYNANVVKTRQEKEDSSKDRKEKDEDYDKETLLPDDVFASYRDRSPELDLPVPDSTPDPHSTADPLTSPESLSPTGSHLNTEDDNESIESDSDNDNDNDSKVTTRHTKRVHFD